MGTLLAGLASLAVPVLARVLIALGMSVVTVTGVAVAVDQLKAQITGSFTGASSAVLQLAGLGGAWQGLGMVLGALTFAATFYSLTQATKIIGKATS